MNLTRKYKIHRLSPCLNEKELEIITFIESKIKGLKLVKKDDFPKSTFYVNSDNRIILHQDDVNDILRVIYKDFWEVLRRKYLLNYPDTQDIMRYMVLIHLKFRAWTPGGQVDVLMLSVLIHLKFRAWTPMPGKGFANNEVLIHFKLPKRIVLIGVNTPQI